MSDHELPEDVSAWPSDPFQLLGAPPDSDARAVKRAYARLVRRFKPEDSPEQFQRIREAYDRANRMVEWRSTIRRVHEDDDAFYEETADEEPASEESTTEEDVDTAPVVDRAPHRSFGSRTPRPVEPSQSPTPLADDISEAWASAEAGDHAAAYASLRSMADRRHGNRELCLRLYWLLRTDASLDESRRAVNWLVTGLRSNGLRGPLFELYRRVLASHPGDAFAEGVADPLDAAGPSSRVVELVTARIAAAGRLGKYDRIADDLERVRDRVADESQEEWVRLLASALDQLAWSRQSEIRGHFETYERELGTYAHLHFAADEVFDRFEMLESVVEGAAMLETSGMGPLAQLVRDAWTRPAHELRPRLMRTLDGWVEAPVSVVESLGRLEGAARPAIAQVHWLVEQLGDSNRWRSPSDLVQGALHGLVLEWSEYHYQAIRPEIVEFCLAEDATPETIVEVATSRQAQEFTVIERLGQLAANVHADLPLRTVVSGVQAFVNAGAA